MKTIVFPSPNGVALSCDEKQVVAVTDQTGQKKLKSFKKKNKVIFWHFPFLRGAQFFFCGLALFFSSLVTSFDLSQGTVKVKDLKKYYTKKIVFLVLVVIVGIALSELLLGFVPNKIGYILVDYRGDRMLRNFVILLCKIVIFYVAVLGLRFIHGMVDLFRFNRAGELDGQKKGVTKDGKKGQFLNWLKMWWLGELGCSNFCNYLIFVFLSDIIVITLVGGGFGIAFNLLFHIAVFLLVTMVCYEMLGVIENVKALNPFKWLTSCLVYAKPTRTHFETVAIAKQEINALQRGREFMEDENKKSFSVVLTEVKNKLSVAGVTDKSDAEWIIATVLGKNRAEIKLVPFVTDKQYEDIMKATERRAKGESVDNIFGFTEFYGLRFDVNKKVLTPRMETELLVEQVLKCQKNFKNCTILDLGTGSGAIAIAIAKNCNATVTAIDISKMALALAEQNAKKNGVKIEFLHSNLFQDLKRKRKFDIIVSNPPYIPSSTLPKLDKNVKECDPVLALDGGEDGLDFYREIISKLGKRLNSNGYVFFEVGKGQAGDVRKLLRENDFEEIKTTKDYNKIERIVSGRIR